MRISLAPRAEPRLVKARVGVFGYFATSGFIMGSWAAGLPAIDERLQLGTGRLGTCLLLIACGSLVSMSFVGRLSDRFTSRHVSRVAGPLSATALLGPALAPSFTWLMVCALVYGFTVGLIEVSMNVNSVELEARYERPIISAFHGFWSLGGAAGGAMTTVGLHAAMNSQLLLVTAIGITIVSFLAFGTVLLPPPHHDHAESRQASRPAGARLAWGIVLLLGIVGFGGHLSEGAAIDWAAVHARRVLDVSLSNAPLAYTVFGSAMTTFRLLGDPIRARLGSARTLLLAGSFATTGYVFVYCSDIVGGFALACCGWAFAGAGLATIVPVVFSAVGAAGGAVGKALSMVTAFGSAGLLIGPATIGHLAEATNLPTALVVPGAFAVIVAVVGPPAIRSLYAHRDKSVAAQLDPTTETV